MAYTIISDPSIQSSYTNGYSGKDLIPDLLVFTEYELLHEDWRCLSDIDQSYEDHMSTKDRRLYSDFPYYYVSNLGRVAKLTDANSLQLIKVYTHRQGYKSVILKDPDNHGTSYLVHRLVAFTFVHNDDPKNKRIINHINEFDKHDNRSVHLEWCDPKYNLHYGTTLERISFKLSSMKRKKVSPSKRSGIPRKRRRKTKIIQFFPKRKYEGETIIQLNPDMTFHKEYTHISNIDPKLFNPRSVILCCHHLKKMYKGFYWMCLDEYNDFLINNNEEPYSL